MSSTDLTLSLLYGIDSAASNSVNNMSANTTIIGIVKEILDIDTAKHRVEYEGALFEATSETGTIYTVGKSVLVNVPNGDLSMPKNITGYYNGSSSGTTATTERYEVVEPYWNYIYDYNPNQECTVTAQESSDVTYLFKAGDMDEEDRASADSTFRFLSQNYGYLRIKASFQLRFSSTHSKGNYGIEVGFVVEDYDNETETTEKILVTRLDVSNFVGQPYYSSAFWSPQYINLEIPAGTLKGVDYIALYQDSFEKDYIMDYSTNEVTEFFTTNNIAASGFELSFLKEIDPTALTLSIIAPKGIYFTKGSTETLELTGKLMQNGENFISTGTCYWFKENLSRVDGDEAFKSEEENQGNLKRWELISSGSDTLYIKGTEFENFWNYKLIVSTSSNNLEAEATIYHEEPNYDVEIIQEVVNENVVFSIKKNNEDDDNTYVADWYQSDWGYSYILSPDGDNEHEAGVESITSRTLNLSRSVTVYCAVKKVEGEDETSETLVNLQAALTVPTSEDDIIVSISGDTNFNYDADKEYTGDSSLEKVITATVEFASGKAVEYISQWICCGRLISTYNTERSDFSKSMFSKCVVWDHSTNRFRFNIKQSYQATDGDSNLIDGFKNNEVYYRIVTVSGDTFDYPCGVYFNPDGDSGTNGTGYSVIVKSHRITWESGSSVVDTQDIHPFIYYGDSAWGNGIKLSAEVERQNLAITYNSRYSISYSWSGVGCTTNGSGSSIVVYPRGEFSKYNDVYVTLTTRIRDTENTGTDGASYTTSIYSHFPISVIYKKDTTALDEAIEIAATFDDTNNISIPSKVVYSASGYHPYISSTYLSHEWWVNGEFIENISNCISLNPELVEINKSPVDDEDLSKGYVYSAVPIEFFNSSSNTVAKILCPLDNKSAEESEYYYLHPIVLYLNVYGNEAINGWDGTSISTENGAVLAPQVGAGYKNTFNQFTGVIMGQDTSQRPWGDTADNPEDSENWLTGLYGYKDGVTTFGLREDGTAFFGSSESAGRIEMDGNQGTISGGGGGENENGMTIYLADLENNKENSRAIHIGGSVEVETYRRNEEGNIEFDEDGNPIMDVEIQDNFSVMYDGSVCANNVRMRGEIYANYGEIGGWGIGSLSKSIGIGSNNTEMADKAIFAIVDKINEDGSVTREGTAFISSIGEMWFGHKHFEHAPFSVLSDGHLRSRKGTIGGFTIDNSELYGPDIYCRDLQSMGVTIRRKDLGDSYYDEGVDEDNQDKVLGVIGQCFGATAEGKVTTGIGIDTRYNAIIPSAYRYNNEKSVYIHSAANVGIKTHIDETPTYNEDGTMQIINKSSADSGSIYLTSGYSAGGQIMTAGRKLAIASRQVVFSPGDWADYIDEEDKISDSSPNVLFEEDVSILIKSPDSVRVQVSSSEIVTLKDYIKMVMSGEV